LLGVSFRERLEIVLTDLINRFGVKEKRGYLIVPELSQLDLAAGPLQETTNPLDVAIAGTGFFSDVRIGDRERDSEPPEQGAPIARA